MTFPAVCPLSSSDLFALSSPQYLICSSTRTKTLFTLRVSFSRQNHPLPVFNCLPTLITTTHPQNKGIVITMSTISTMSTMSTATTAVAAEPAEPATTTSPSHQQPTNE